MAVPTKVLLDPPLSLNGREWWELITVGLGASIGVFFTLLSFASPPPMTLESALSLVSFLFLAGWGMIYCLQIVSSAFLPLYEVKGSVTKRSPFPMGDDILTPEYQIEVCGIPIHLPLEVYENIREGDEVSILRRRYTTRAIYVALQGTDKRAKL